MKVFKIFSKRDKEMEKKLGWKKSYAILILCQLIGFQLANAITFYSGSYHFRFFAITFNAIFGVIFGMIFYLKHAYEIVFEKK